MLGPNNLTPCLAKLSCVEPVSWVGTPASIPVDLPFALYGGTLTSNPFTLGSYIARALGRNVKNVVHVASRNPSKVYTQLQSEMPFADARESFNSNH